MINVLVKNEGISAVEVIDNLGKTYVLEPNTELYVAEGTFKVKRHYKECVIDSTGDCESCQ